MVALRERKARPSYSNIPEGLSDLSDSTDSQSGQNSQSASKSAFEQDEQDESLPSSGSSEFQPAEDEIRRPSKGKRKAVISFEEEDEDMEAGNEDENENDDEREKEEVKDRMLEDLAVQPGTPIKEISVETANHASQPSIQPASIRKAERSSYTYSYSGHEALMLPAPYRDYIKQSSIRLTKPRLKYSGVKKVRDDRINQGISVYPEGPVTPFVTRLKGPIKNRGKAQIEFVVEPEDVGERIVKRKLRALNVGKYVPFISPLEVWEGESWWPEMWQGGDGYDQIKGKAKERNLDSKKRTKKAMPGWKLREEVRMGLDQVGRHTWNELELLNEQYGYRCY